MTTAKTPKFTAGQQVEYIGWDNELANQVFTVESPAIYRPSYEPAGYYYDLAHCNLKRVHESDIVKATEDTLVFRTDRQAWTFL